MISKVVYEGELRTKAVHISSGNIIVTDAPKDNQGKGEAFSPTDLVATALAGCILTIMGIIAKRSNQNLNGTYAEVEKRMGSEPRSISEIKVRIFLNKKILKKERAKFERAAKACPVSLSLHPDLVKVINFIYL
ncbi:OsmC family protein [Candidatus Marinimicrobia bacterium]|nr:OsmC family protein [Candidatus Neomarinimicrobiota bacterium]MDA9656475.1 OsmC family protein [Candidatus Neomarinimicrobiota bacterium]